LIGHLRLMELKDSFELVAIRLHSKLPHCLFSHRFTTEASKFLPITNDRAKLHIKHFCYLQLIVSAQDQQGALPCARLCFF
jgi:hypothetical protein